MFGNEVRLFGGFSDVPNVNLFTKCSKKDANRNTVQVWSRGQAVENRRGTKSIPSPTTFRAVSEQGDALRRLHPMEDAAIGETPFAFEVRGTEWWRSRFEIPPPWGRGTSAAGGGAQA